MVAEAKKQSNDVATEGSAGANVKGEADDDDDDEANSMSKEEMSAEFKSIDESKDSRDNDSSSNSSIFEVGSEVELFGLKSRPELNHRIGVIVEEVSSVLFTVVLYPIKEKNKEADTAGCEYRVKPKNLKLTDNKIVDKQRAAILLREAKNFAAQAKEKEATPPSAPIMMFCQPVPLESLIQQVLNIGDYKTFSIIMRMKVMFKHICLSFVILFYFLLDPLL